eukprot:491785_1
MSNNYDEKNQESVEKWYWKTDNGKYKPMNDNMCQRLNDLTIGESMKTKIGNAMYEFKKTTIGKGQQRNIRTNKSRDICIGKYGWFYEDNNKLLKPFTNQLSQQINDCAIGSSFTFSLKSGTKYELSKTSKNQGKQKNLSTKFERNIVYKMTLNDDNDSSSSGSGYNNICGSIATANGGRDWVKEREKKAMKTGKTIRCKLMQKRNLFEDTADAHFRRCESQFMRSCTNLGLSTNGLNNTIKEVEYIINPKLIKKFEAKKKKLMWIYSNKHLEWFQVVMTFNNTLQRIEDLNLVAIRLRFKEYFCYPMLNKNGTTDIKKWIIETRKYEPRVEHLRRLRRHVTYYKKKWWNGVDPSKYELDVDDGIIEYYGRNIFDENIYKNDINKKDIKNKNEGNDDDLIKMVQALEKKFERNRKLKQAEGLNDMNSSMQMDT